MKINKKESGIRNQESGNKPIISTLVPYPLFFILFLFIPFFARAATNECASKICNPLGEKTTNLAQVVGFFITTILPIIGAVALLMFIVGAVFWIISGGSPEKVKQGRDTIVWTVIGSIIIIGSYVALSFIFRVITAGLPNYAASNPPPTQGTQQGP